MKKIVSAILTTAMTVSVFSSVPVYSKNDEINVMLDGKKIEFDVQPEVINGRTMVPLRKIFEEIGALVKWDNDTQTVTARKSSKTISLTVDSNELKIDKGKTDEEGNPIVETITLEVPAREVSGRTLVPARAISESFGLNVDWDEADNSVIITSDDEKDDSWKENTGTINLSEMTFDGEGVFIEGNNIKITAGGDYTLIGTLADGNITVTAKDRVKLRLEGADITSSEGPCIFFEETDKAFITIGKNTENTLVASNSEDGAVYSKENIEFKGSGKLYIKSPAGHGIKASDNMTVEEGDISIEASGDGIHINDTFKMTGGNIDIVATGDGIDSESIVIISDGKINVKTNAVPVSGVSDTKTEEKTENENMPRFPMMGQQTEIEFEKSSKGINAEWMMTVSGGEITVDSASHAVHCEDEMQIDGGVFNLRSEYEKGISAHGNLTINGKDTVINVTKSTEGIESKNVMTINDGDIYVVSSDDAINATGGRSGAMMGMGPMGGNRENNGKNNGENPNNENKDNTDRRNNINRENGFNRTPAEGFEKAPSDQASQSENKDEAQQKRPGRGNGRFGGAQTFDPNGENKEFTPPNFENRENGEFTPPAFGNGENREFTPPAFGNGENGEFTPPAFGNRENGEFTPPAFENGENGGFTPPFGERPGMNPDGQGAMPGANRGGMGRNMKECLVINGGNLELHGEDDCIDANGNITINGGTVKASNPNGAFTGNFGVIDSDGQLKIAEKANIILICSNGNERGLGLAQNSIIVYCDKAHNAGDKIIVKDKKDNVIFEYTSAGRFSTVFIGSEKLITGETYDITIGDETHEAEILSQSTVIGTRANGNMGFGRGGRRPEAKQD